MPKLFPIIARPRIVSGGDAGVTVERVQYDLPEFAPIPQDVPGLVFSDMQWMPAPSEDSGVGVLARDEIVSPALVEQTGITATQNENALMTAPLDEAALSLVDLQTLMAPGEEIEISITLASNADQVTSNSNWTNPNSVLGETNQQAYLAASSSGLLGLRSNTKTGTLELALPPMNLGWLNISAVNLVSFHSSGVSGLTGNGNYNVDFQHRIGGVWATYAPIRTANVSAIERSYDVTALVAEDWSNLSGFAVRGTGSVTSGSGLGAQRTVYWRYVRLEITAQRSE